MKDQGPLLLGQLLSKLGLYASHASSRFYPLPHLSPPINRNHKFHPCPYRQPSSQPKRLSLHTLDDRTSGRLRNLQLREHIPRLLVSLVEADHTRAPCP